MKSKLLLFAISVCLLTPAFSATVDPPQRVEPERQVAVTFDDLPANGDLKKMRYTTEKLLASIKAHGVPAIGFVNEYRLLPETEKEQRTALLKMWLDAGLELGNHTYSHIAIDRASIEEYKQDVVRGEQVTRKLLGERGMKLRYFRHTQLRTGPTPEYKNALDKFLKERGYTVAPVTIDNNDYIYARVYETAKARGDRAQMKAIVDSYLSYMDRIFDFFEKLSREALGYEVRQTLLLHANELNADHFGALAEMMKRRGYRFISLEEALKDAAYNLPDAQVKMGLSWIHRWMIARGEKMRPEPREPDFITKLFEARQSR
jgi:peptidoglycan/xylan/chitin deacetylase (PgdA/CDA1 family)